MKPIMPLVWLDGDSKDTPMAGYGVLVGVSRARAVWRFGFEPGTLLARAFGVATQHPMWTLALHNGTVIETYFGDWRSRLPVRFLNTIGARL